MVRPVLAAIVHLALGCVAALVLVAAAGCSDEPERPAGAASATPSSHVIITNISKGDEPTPTPRPPEDCGDILAAVDKERPLPAGCEPPDLQPIPGRMVAAGAPRLRSAAVEAFASLVDAAARDGMSIFALSAYRSFSDQITAHEQNVAECGGDEACADRVSARPGHSEHQLGTTVDVVTGRDGFELEQFRGAPEAAWLLANSWKYGFIVSYPEGKDDVTGYAWEPWHIRWIGAGEAARVVSSGLTLHEYLLAR